jgi:hypothetical protein
MNQISTNAVTLVSQGLELLSIQGVYLGYDKRKPLSANRAFPEKVWEDVISRGIEDFSVVYIVPEEGFLKVHVNFEEDYIAEDRDDWSDYRVRYNYSGVMQIDHASGPELLRLGAETVLAQMKDMARDFLRLSKPIKA